MSTIEEEPEFLAAVIPKLNQREKRMAVRTYHREELHKYPISSTDKLLIAESILSPSDIRNAIVIHDSYGQHNLGQDPGPREHLRKEPRNPWRTHR